MANKELQRLARISERHRRIFMSSRECEPMSQITVRIPQSARDGLADIAKQVRTATGEESRMADIVRLAIAEFLEREEKAAGKT